MKKIALIILISSFFFCSPSAYSQKYKTAADTVKLNKEHLKLTTGIADLNIQLAASKENLKKYQENLASKNKDAQSSAESSSDQASKATNGSVKDARRAKRKANAAYTDAKQSRDANDKMNSEEKRLNRITNDLQKKQDRLNELDMMRAAILRIKTPAQGNYFEKKIIPVQ